MVLNFRTVIFFIVVMAAGCAPKPISLPTTKPTPEFPGQLAFEKAETLFENGQIAEALDSYNAFLRKAEGDRSVDAALFKIGTILRRMNNDDDAFSVFNRLSHEYPKSPLVSDAILEMLFISYEKGEYPFVVHRGIAHTESTDPSIERGPFFLIVADACLAEELYLDAARFYYRAWNTTTGSQKDIAWAQFNQAMEQLDPEALLQLNADVTDPEMRSTLLYRLSMAFILNEKYDEAIDVLQVFADRYPQHPDHQDALDMIHTITERSRFKPFTVGCVLPQTGAYAAYGKRAMEGIELALIHSIQGSDGIPFSLFIADSGSDEETTKIAMEELNQQRVGAVLGPMGASVTAAESAQAEGIPIFVFTQREGIVDVGPYVFRNFITPLMQTRSLVSFSMEELGVRRFAVLFPEEKYGRRYMNLFWDQVIEQGGSVTAVETYDPEITDFAESIKKLGGIYYRVPKTLSKKSIPKQNISSLDFIVNPDFLENRKIDDPLERFSGLPLDRKTIDSLGRRAREAEDRWDPIIDFDAVFIPDAPKKAGLIIPQLAYYDIRDVFLLGTNLWNSKTLLKMSRGYMKDTVIVDGFFSKSESERVKDFVEAFQRTFDRIPGIIEASAYDCAMMVFQTMRQTATDSRRELKNALLQISDFEGVSGRTGFFQNGEAEKILEILRIEKGAFVQARRTAESAFAADR